MKVKKLHLIISFVLSFIAFNINEDFGTGIFLIFIILAVIYYKQNKKIKPKVTSYPKDFTIIDVETTGLRAFTSEIVEFAAIKVRNLEIVDEFSTLCHPVVPIENSNIHGIKDEDVKNYEYFSGYIPEILKFIGDDTITAYNAPFDMEFFNSYLGKDLKNKIFDILEIARNYDHRSSFKLENIKKDLKIETKSHRALDDCKTTLEYYKYLIKNNPKLEVNYITCLTTDSRIKPKRNTTYIKWLKENYKPIETKTNNYDLFNSKNFCFSGIFKKIDISNLYKEILNCGGCLQERTTLKTDYLIVGEYKDTTQNHKKGIDYSNKENNMKILTEDEFLDLIK